VQRSWLPVAVLSTWKSPFEVVDKNQVHAISSGSALTGWVRGEDRFRAEDQAKQQVVDVFESLNAFVDVGWLKRHVLLERHRNASSNPVSVPPAIAPLVIGFV
jgi:hypothetical protein